MRLRRRFRAAGTAVAFASVSMLAWFACAAAVLAASPTATAGGDPRSAGQGPGLVGDPLLAIAIVAAIGVVSLVATLAWVRATGGPRRS
jgi:hypothetical protein